MKLLTTGEAAARLGITVARVHALIRANRLPAKKIGRDYVITPADLKLVSQRKPGRPRLKRGKKTRNKSAEEKRRE